MEWLGLGKGKKKAVVEEKKAYLDSKFLHHKIVDFDFVHGVKLPPGVDLNEWLATHAVNFFKNINLIFGTVNEQCTTANCPIMNAGATQYNWYDDKNKKIKLSAPQYIDTVMSFIEKQVNDEEIFSTKYGTEFPSCFQNIIKKIFKILFHVIAHIYHSHFQTIIDLEESTHLNALLLHYVLFTREFNLLDEKETSPLDDLIQMLKATT
ncbi:MOB kinase activator 2 [Trichoplax sp. H2]|nr:MOB kinase activator 2 [Trichoplax sp. H2]|eukprot:RDD39166.1 MOB kinase activator 2 [Trichoplax sp. H2]